MPRSRHVEIVLPGTGRMVRIQQPILCHEEFAMGPPYRSGGHLTDLHRRYILWQVSLRAPIKQIADDLGASRSTVREVFDYARRDSGHLVEIGLVTKHAPAYRQRTPRWASVIDGQTFSGTATASRWAYQLIFHPVEHRFSTTRGPWD